jgi:hypothetical protein
MKIDKIKLIGATVLVASGLLANQAHAGNYSVWPTSIERQMAIDKACEEKAHHQPYSTGTECPEPMTASEQQRLDKFNKALLEGVLGITLVGAAIVALRDRQEKKKQKNEANNPIM